MSDTEHRVSIKITGDSAGGRKAMADASQAGQGLQQKLEGVGAAGSKAGQATADGMREAGQEVGDTSALAAKLTGALAGLASIDALRRFVGDLMDARREAEASFRGLEAVANHAGVGIGQAFKTAADLASDGLLTVSQAGQALQNLLSRKYSEGDAVQVLTRLKDAAAFNRAAHLSLGEAVVTATEGIKNENSVLVDNAGVTKNVSKMWEEYAKQIGTTAEKLTQAQKVQAEVNGILKETEAQAGNAQKALAGVDGQLAKSAQSWAQYKIAAGSALVGAQEAGATGWDAFVRDVLTPVSSGLETMDAIGSAALQHLAIYFASGDAGAMAIQARVRDINYQLAEQVSLSKERYELGITRAMQEALDKADPMRVQMREVRRDEEDYQILVGRRAEALAEAAQAEAAAAKSGLLAGRMPGWHKQAADDARDLAAANARLAEIAADLAPYEERLAVAAQRVADAQTGSAASALALTEQQRMLADQLQGVEERATKATASLQGMADADLIASVRALGLDLGEMATGLTETERAAIAAFDRMASSAAATGEQIVQAAGPAAQTAGRAGANAIRQTLIRALDEGQISARQFAEAIRAIEPAALEAAGSAGRALDALLGRIEQLQGAGAGGDGPSLGGLLGRVNAARQAGAKGDAAGVASAGADAVKEIDGLAKAGKLSGSEVDYWLGQLRALAQAHKDVADAAGNTARADAIERGKAEGRAGKKPKGSGVEGTPSVDFGPGRTPPVQVPVEIDSRGARADLEAELGGQPIRVAVQFVSVGSDIDAAALALGDA